MENIVVSVFKIESEAFQAMTELRNGLGVGDIIMPEAVLVKKEEGVYKVLDGYNETADYGDDTVAGGLIGMCIGILGGPIGILLGGGIGALAGASMDSKDACQDMSLLEQIMGKLPDGTVAIVGLAYEENEAILDNILSRYDTIIARFDAAVVEQEVEKAKEMEKEMQRQAKLEVRQQKKDEHKDKVEERRNKMKARHAAFKEKHKKDKE